MVVERSTSNLFSSQANHNDNNIKVTCESIMFYIKLYRSVSKGIKSTLLGAWLIHQKRSRVSNDAKQLKHQITILQALFSLTYDAHKCILTKGQRSEYRSSSLHR